MEWLRLSSKLRDDEKWLALTGNEKAAVIEAMCWTAEHERDGFVPTAMLQRYAAKLIDVGWITETTGGYLFPTWKRHQVSRAKLKAQRKAAKDRMQRARSVRANTSRTSREVAPTEERRGEESKTREEPTTRSKTAGAATRRPSHDHVYLVSKINERWGEGGNLTMGAVQKFIGRYGYAETDSALRALHGFPPEEAVRSAYAYVDAILKGEAS